VNFSARHDDDADDDDDDDDDDDIRRQTIPSETIMRGVYKIGLSVPKFRLELQNIVEGHLMTG
jgi:hypothetical protein